MRAKKDNLSRLNPFRLQTPELSENDKTLYEMCKEIEDTMKRKKRQEIVENYTM